MRRRTEIGILAVLFALLSPCAFAQEQSEPSLSTVLDRLGAYLTDYADKIPATIASEHYFQRARLRSSGNPFWGAVTLDSDFGIVRLPGVHEWLGFREVLKADGKPVVDHERGLDVIFKEHSGDVLRQAQMISRESAKRNIGVVFRTINNPAILLELLDARNRSRMRFKKAGEEEFDGVRAWVIRFEETHHPTIVTTPGGHNSPANGRCWIDPADGALLQAEATFVVPALNPVTGMLKVTFTDEPRLGFRVPSRMIESYVSGRNELASGEARYSNYRLFTVDTKVILSP